MSVHQLVLPSPLCSPMFLPFLQHRGCQGWRRQGPVRPGPGWSLRSHILSPGPPGCWRGSLAGWWWGPRWCTAPSRIWHSWGGGGGRGQVILTYIIDKTIGLETVLLSLLPIYLHGIYLQQIYTFSKIGSFSNTIILVFSFTGFSGFFVSTARV